MNPNSRRSLLATPIAVALVAFATPLRALDLPGTEPPPADFETEAVSTDRTPPRLSHIDGQASFWREGAEEWTQARVNTPLAPGDQLFVDNGSNLELQIGSRDFLRVASNSQLAFDNDERDYRQFRLTAGQASLDLYGLRPGQVVELDTPNGAFTIERDGYYRAEVGDDATRFVTRRGGQAVLTPASGQPTSIAANEAIVVRGDDVANYAASDPDAWDRWNDERSNRVVEAVSYRHVPREVYGAADLDQSGRWRAVPQYGSVWFPTRVATGWAPYTTGRWMNDPYYGWTWVDDAAWGWAPFHYGRWVFVNDYWGWAPGPIVARPYYAPALVAFFSAGPFSIGVSVGGPRLGWTALGWGEPCRPWWGPRNFAGRPRWLGWGGPRVTYNQTVINNVNFYRNSRARNGMVVVERDRFARGPVAGSRVEAGRRDRMRAIDGALPVRADGVRVVGGAERARRPPLADRNRRVVATRESAVASMRGARHGGAPPKPEARLVPSPRDGRADRAVERSRSGALARVDRVDARPPRAADLRRGGSSDRREPSGASRSTTSASRSGAVRGAGRREQVDRPTAVQPPAATARSRDSVGRSQAQRSPARSAPSRARAVASPPQRSVAAQRPAAAQRSMTPQRSVQPSAAASRASRGKASRSESVVPRATRERVAQPANRVQASRRSASSAAAPPQAEPRKAAASRAAAVQKRGGGAQRRDAAAAAEPGQAVRAARNDAVVRARGNR